MLPKDPIILLSYVNTQLRDRRIGLADLCASEGADRDQVEKALAAVDYFYDKEVNQFK